MKTLMIITIFFCSISCASTNKYAQPTALMAQSAPSFPPENLLVRLKPFSPPKYRNAADSDLLNSKCRFESIPGAFWGITNYQPFNEYEIKGTKINIDLNNKVFDDRLQIGEFSKNDSDAVYDIHVSPKNAKFALIATMCDKYPSGFINKEQNALSLVYFDQPTRISGEIKSNSISHRFSLDIPKAGFYFIEYRRTNEGQQSTDGYYIGKDIYYFVVLQN